MKTLYLTTIVFLLLAVPARAEIFGAKSFTLDNGLEVVWVENHRAPVIAHGLWIRIGATDEEPGRSGLAHLVEHLMFKGTGALEDGQYSQVVASMGGRTNAFTSWDFTYYLTSVGADRLGDVMALEAERLRGLDPPSDSFETEKSVVLAEEAQVYGRNPFRRLISRVRAALFPDHPYGIPIIGDRTDIEALTKADAQLFHKRHYMPGNAFVVVSGNVTEDELRALAQRYYGPLPARSIHTRRTGQAPLPQEDAQVDLTDPTVRQPMLVLAWRAPGHADDPDAAYALQLLKTILSGGATARLYRSLAVEDGLAASVNVNYNPSARNGAVLMITATPAGNISLKTLETATQAQIADLLASGVTSDEIARAKTRLLAAAEYARDGLTGPVRTLGRALVTGRTVADVENWPARIEAVTKAETDAVIKAVFTGHRVTGYLLAKEAEETDAPTP
ncbi:MAG: pitrilysin family protein [Pseudomonadota bacterium]|nr:pitrilysin family protein [Pseudomonadota bacterium]